MKSKCLSFFFIFSILPVPHLFAKPICYQNLQAYLIESFGHEYEQDSNIQINSVKGTPFTWVEDHTANNNPTRYLLKSSKQNTCLLLTANMAQTINFKLRKNFLPNTITTTSGYTNGFGQVLLKYKKENDGSYSLADCKQLNNGKVTKIDCSDYSN